MADDMQVKELHAIINSDTRSIGLKPFSVQGAFESMNLTERTDFDKSKYQKVYSFKERNTHPFNIAYDFDIFMEHTDEPLSLLQE